MRQGIHEMDTPRNTPPGLFFPLPHETRRAGRQNIRTQKRQAVGLPFFVLSFAFILRLIGVVLALHALRDGLQDIALQALAGSGGGSTDLLPVFFTRFYGDKVTFCIVIVVISAFCL